MKSSISYFFACWILIQSFICINQKAFEVSEAREGVVVWEVLNGDSLVLPLRHGSIVPSKPPLFHWLSAGVSKLTGNFGDLELRLPSLVASICLLLSIFFLLKKILTLETALISTLVASITYTQLQLSSDGRVDMLFSCLIGIAFLVFNKLLLEEDTTLKSSNKIILGTLLGLGILAKGPLSPVLFYVATFPTLLLHSKNKSQDQSYFKLSFGIIKNWYCNLSLVFIFIISIPWYILAYLEGSSSFIGRQIWFENIGRFIGSTGIPDKSKLFYLTHFFTQLQPTGLLAIILALMFYINRKKSVSLFKEDLNTKESALIKNLVIQIISILVFFTLSSGKRRAYLLPLVPHFSIIFAVYYSKIKNEVFSKNSFLTFTKYLKYLTFAVIFWVLSLSILKLLLFSVIPEKYHNSFLLGIHEAPSMTFFYLFLVTLTTALLFKILRKKYLSEQTGLTFFYLLSSFILLLHISLPTSFYLTKGYSHSYYPLSLELKELVQKDEKIIAIKKKEDEYLDTLFYYLPTRVEIFPDQNENNETQTPTEKAVYITRLNWLEDQDQSFKDSIQVLKVTKKLKEKTGSGNEVVIFRIN